MSHLNGSLETQKSLQRQQPQHNPQQQYQQLWLKYEERKKITFLRLNMIYLQLNIPYVPNALYIYPKWLPIDTDDDKFILIFQMDPADLKL